MSAPRTPKATAVEDLTIEARRGTLSDEDRRKLERALTASPTLRVAHDVGRAFDAIAGVRAGDEELIARLADRALAPLAPRKAFRVGPPRRRLAWAFGIAAVLASSGALAWYSAVERSQVASGAPSNFVPPVSNALSGTQRASAASELARPSPATTAESQVLPIAAAIVAPSAHHVVAGVAAGAAGMGGSEASSPERARDDRENAAEAFRRANAARRAGNLLAASELYRALQANFASSEEARLSRVSFGKILLASGKALDAERQFTVYLSKGGGDLTEEALSGRAESLEHLGRKREETQTWERLLRDFPTSVYAARAKERLQELPAGAP